MENNISSQGNIPSECSCSTCEACFGRATALNSGSVQQKKTAYCGLGAPPGLTKKKQLSIVFSSGVAQRTSETSRVYRGEISRHSTATGEQTLDPCIPRLAVYRVVRSNTKALALPLRICSYFSPHSELRVCRSGYSVQNMFR